MDINLVTLNTQGRVDFEGVPDFKDYASNEIKSLEDMHVKGHIIDNGTDEYEVVFHLEGKLTLVSAINKSDVLWPITIDFDDFVSNFVENYKKSANTLDILPILWENILLEIPIRAVNESDEFVREAGEGWEILKTE